MENKSDKNSDFPKNIEDKTNPSSDIENQTKSTTNTYNNNIKKKYNNYNKFAPYIPDKIKNQEKKENQSEKQEISKDETKNDKKEVSNQWLTLDIPLSETANEENEQKERVFYELKKTNILHKTQKKQPSESEIRNTDQQNELPKAHFKLDPSKIKSRDDQSEKKYHHNSNTNRQRRNYNDQRNYIHNMSQMNYNRNNRKPHLHITREDINKTKQLMNDYYAEKSPQSDLNFDITLNDQQETELTPDEKFQQYYNQFFVDDENNSSTNDNEDFPEQPFIPRNRIDPFEDKYNKEKKEIDEKPFMFNDIALQTQSDLNKNNFDNIKELTKKQDEINKKRREMEENRRKNIPDEIVSFVKPRKTAIEISQNGIFIKKHQDRTDPNGLYVTNDSKDKGFLKEKIPRIMKTNVGGVDLLIERPDKEVEKTFVISKKDGTASRTILTNASQKVPIFSETDTININSSTNNKQEDINQSIPPDTNAIEIEYPTRSPSQQQQKQPLNPKNDTITSNFDFFNESDDEAQKHKIQDNIKLYKKLMDLNNNDEEEDYQEEENYSDGYYYDDEYYEDDDRPIYSYYFDEFENKRVKLTHKSNNPPIVFDKRKIETFPPTKPQNDDPVITREQNEIQDPDITPLSTSDIQSPIPLVNNQNVNIDNNNSNTLKITVEALPEKRSEDYENPFREFLQNKIKGTTSFEIKQVKQNINKNDDQLNKNNEPNNETELRQIEEDNIDDSLQNSIQSSNDRNENEIKEEISYEEESQNEEEEKYDDTNINTYKPQNHSLSTDQMIDEIKLKKEMKEKQMDSDKTEITENQETKVEETQKSENDVVSGITSELKIETPSEYNKPARKTKKIRSKTISRTKKSYFTLTNLLLTLCIFLLVILIIRTYY